MAIIRPKIIYPLIDLSNTFSKTSFENYHDLIHINDPVFIIKRGKYVEPI